MKAFHGKSTIKKEYLDKVSARILADDLIKGKYWEGGKGCAVGCTIHNANHNAPAVNTAAVNTTTATVAATTYTPRQQKMSVLAKELLKLIKGLK